MRILPVTNTPIITEPAFKQKPNVKVLKKEEAQALLNNYESITREHFKNGYIYQGIAKLDFEKYKPEGKKNIENFKKLYPHALINLGLKIEELRLDVAFKEAINKSNYYLLEVMIKDMGMFPITPEGEINTFMLYSYNGFCATELRNVLGNIIRELHYSGKLFGNYIPPVQDNSSKIALLKQQSIDMINRDEEAEGIVSIDTIYKIVSNPKFKNIKDEPLNISGSRILHILSESSFDTNNIKETNLVRDIIQKCTDAGYDFDIKNDFEETALDKAREAENNFLIDLLEKRRTKC